MIEWADIERLVTELQNASNPLTEDATDILERMDISEEVFMRCCNELLRTTKNGIGEMIVEEPNESTSHILDVCIMAGIGTALTLGWDLRDQYGQERTVIKDVQ